MNKMSSNFYANFSRDMILRFRFVDQITGLGVNKVTAELEKVINAFNLNYNQTISDIGATRKYVYPIIEEKLTNDEYAFLVMMVLQYLQHQYFSSIPTMKTVPNSKPFAEWMVIKVILSLDESSLSISVNRDTVER